MGNDPPIWPDTTECVEEGPEEAPKVVDTVGVGATVPFDL